MEAIDGQDDLPDRPTAIGGVCIYKRMIARPRVVRIELSKIKVANRGLH